MIFALRVFSVTLFLIDFCKGLILILGMPLLRSFSAHNNYKYQIVSFLPFSSISTLRIHSSIYDISRKLRKFGLSRRALWVKIKLPKRKSQNSVRGGKNDATGRHCYGRIVLRNFNDRGQLIFVRYGELEHCHIFLIRLQTSRNDVTIQLQFGIVPCIYFSQTKLNYVANKLNVRYLYIYESFS